MNVQKKYHYLIVDDEVPVLKIISDILTIHPSTTQIFTAPDAEKALDIYEHNTVDIVITDILMPRMSGIDFIKKLKQMNPDVHIIVVSGLNNIDMVRQSMRSGAYDYIIKPFSVDEIMFSVNRIIDRMRLLEERKTYVDNLEAKISENVSVLRSSFDRSLQEVNRTLYLRGGFEADHAKNVRDYSMKLAEKLNLNGKELEGIRRGSELHDIGKIAIPDSIMMKEGGLTPEDVLIVRKHPVVGRDILLPVAGDDRTLMDIVTFHHERYDGSGYPEGLKGEQIPYAARLVAVADVYDAMTSPRPYHAVRSKEEALDEIKKLSGRTFDPHMAAAFVSVMKR
jgi:response regulator RpfG family c-di-GMP phosphodiesterase